MGLYSKELQIGANNPISVSHEISPLLTLKEDSEKAKLFGREIITVAEIFSLSQKLIALTIIVNASERRRKDIWKIEGK